MKTTLPLIVSALLLLAGCSEPQQAVKTTQYYNEHVDEAKEVVQECKSITNPPMDEIANCSNAKTSVWHSGGIKRIKGNEKSVKTWKE